MNPWGCWGNVEEVGGMGQEQWEGWGSWVRERRFGFFPVGLRRTFGLRRLSASSVVEVIWRDGLRVGGIELGGLVEVDR